MAKEAQDAVVVVPHTELRAYVLRSVIESFVLREGTDYGERELSLQSQVAAKLRPVRRESD